ncbi:uncharacterized protein VNE69_01255 [Vairimorpha necatrix]|uniref:Fam-a protein n=1 Tax=Vairimorpha necatrix TaxID=6039 RepID=A0AAX4J8V1_9MICR
MFLVSLLFILNVQKIKSTEETSPKVSVEEKNQRMNEYKKCSEVLLEDRNPIYYDNYFTDREKPILKILFESVLDNIKFPIESKPYWPKRFRNKQYEIVREDFEPMFHWIKNGTNAITLSIFKDKPAARRLLYSLAQHVVKLYKPLICYNYNANKINLQKLKIIISMFLDIKTDEKYKFNIIQVFRDNDYELIMKIVEESNEIVLIQQTTKTSNMIKDNVHKIKSKGYPNFITQAMIGGYLQ